MFDMLFRIQAAVGPNVAWIVKCSAAVVAIFVLYVGIAIWATLRAPDAEQRNVRYQIFRDLLDLFRRGGNR